MASEPGVKLLGDQFPDPPCRRCYVPLWKGQGTCVVDFWIMGKRIHWFDTHFLDGRVVPCIGTFSTCKSCELGWKPRARGFVAAMRHGTGGVYLLTVTRQVLLTLPVLRIVNAPLHGLGVHVSRRGPSVHSAWHWTANMRVAPPVLPPSPDIFPIVENLWGVDLRRLNNCPPADGDVRRLLQPYKTERNGER